MLEYIIARTDGDYFDLHFEQLADALHPITFPSKKVEGWGEWRIEVEGCEVSFSGEPPGYQVSFECDDIEPDTARKIVNEILLNVESLTGQKAEVIEI